MRPKGRDWFSSRGRQPPGGLALAPGGLAFGPWCRPRNGALGIPPLAHAGGSVLFVLGRFHRWLTPAARSYTFWEVACRKVRPGVPDLLGFVLAPVARLCSRMGPAGERSEPRPLTWTGIADVPCLPVAAWFGSLAAALWWGLGLCGSIAGQRQRRGGEDLDPGEVFPGAVGWQVLLPQGDPAVPRDFQLADA